ncbi:MAG: hypothetical protein RIT45_2995 [Pseudomonadota bacterium]|jgi:hypothetical protein
MSGRVNVELPEPPNGAREVRLAWSGSRRVETFAVRGAGESRQFAIDEPAWLDAFRGRGVLLIATWLGEDGVELAIDSLERTGGR